jgi:hypothetical protein
MAQVYLPSRYQPIWDALKAQGQCRIVAPLPLHRRIIKAVIKRKDEDLGYKLELSEKYKKAKLAYKIEGNTITFTLHTRSIICLGAL